MPASDGPAAAWPSGKVAAGARRARTGSATMAPRRWWCSLALALPVLLVVPAKADPFDRTVEGGWYLWDPYQYVQTRAATRS